MTLADLNAWALRSKEHGTYARYVTGCRCEPCTEARRVKQRERIRRVQVAAADVEPNPDPPAFRVFHRTAPDGSRYEVRCKACPGTGGKRCVVGGAWLRQGRRVCMSCVDRAAVWSGMVPADRARRHLDVLSALGVGGLAVAAACDVSKTVIFDIKRGAMTRIRADAERRILRVDAGAIADGALVPSGPTWALIDDLVAHGFTRRWISGELGAKRYCTLFTYDRRFGLRPNVTARLAHDVERLHRRVLDNQVEPPSPFVDAAPIYRILNELLKRVPRKWLSKLIGYHSMKHPPRRVYVATAEKVRAFAAELERRRVEGEPLPDEWQVSPFATAFGSKFEGGTAWQWERRQGKRARRREEKELRALAAGRAPMPERQRVRRREYRTAEYRARHRQYARASYAKNPEKHRKYAKDLRAMNREHFRKYQREQRAKNLERFLGYERKAREKRKAKRKAMER